jgi:hypothetical protein
MVRVVVENKQQALNDEQKKLFSLIGLSIDKHPQIYQALLRKYNALDNPNSHSEELKDNLLLMLSKKNVRFNGELSEVLKRQADDSSYDDGEESFSLADISTVLNSASTLVGNFGSGKTQKAIAREEMKKSTYEKMLEVKSQNEKTKVEQQSKDNKTIWITVGITFGVLVLGIGAALYFTKEKPQVA